MDGGLEGDRLCPAKMPARPTMVIELKTAARRRCRRRPRPTRPRAGRITVKKSAADDPTAMKGAPATSSSTSTSTSIASAKKSNLRGEGERGGK